MLELWRLGKGVIGWPECIADAISLAAKHGAGGYLICDADSGAKLFRFGLYEAQMPTMSHEGRREFAPSLN